jgi:hypothetical protein
MINIASFRIVRDNCNACNQNNKLGVTSRTGSRVIFHFCRDCDRELFDRVSREQVDAWLKNGRVE